MREREKVSPDLWRKIKWYQNVLPTQKGFLCINVKYYFVPYNKTIFLLIFDFIWIMDWGNTFLLCISFEKDITSSSSSNVNVERCLSMIFLLMNQWGKKRLCVRTQLMMFLRQLPSIFKFLSSFWEVTLRTRPSIIWVIFYHFTWVSFHQLIKKDFLYIFEIISRFLLVTHEFEQQKKVLRVLSYWNLFHFDSHLTSTSSWCEDDKICNFHNELFSSSPLSFWGHGCYWWKRFSCNLLKSEGRWNPWHGKNVVASIHNI